MKKRIWGILICAVFCASNLMAQDEATANRVLRLAQKARAQADGGDVRAFTKALPEAEACCSPFGTFNFTGVLTMSADSGGTECVNCVAGVPDNDIGIKFPEAVFFLGQGYSATMTFQSQIPGPCDATFLLFNPALNQVIAGNTLALADCGANNIWLIEFFGNVVPNVAAVTGNNVLVGLIQASDGTVKTDFEQIVIQ